MSEGIRMPDAVTENGVVLAPFSVTTVISTEASDTPSHPVISTEASGSERSGEIPQTESDYVHADFSISPDGYSRNDNGGDGQKGLQ